MCEGTDTLAHTSLEVNLSLKISGSRAVSSKRASRRQCAQDHFHVSVFLFHLNQRHTVTSGDSQEHHLRSLGISSFDRNSGSFSSLRKTQQVIAAHFCGSLDPEAVGAC